MKPAGPCRRGRRAWILALLLAWLPVWGLPGFAAPSPAGEGRLLGGSWKFHTGDDPAWADPAFDDGAWGRIASDRPWGAQGFRGYGGWAWYRLEVPAPEGEAAVAFGVAPHCAFEAYAGGKLLGRSGSFAPAPEIPVLPQLQVFRIPPEAPRGGRLTLALRVWFPPKLAALFPGEGGFQGEAGEVGPPARVAEHAAARSESLRLRHLEQRLHLVMLLVVFLGAGLFHIQIYLLRRQIREYLWYGLLNLAFAASVFLDTPWGEGLSANQLTRLKVASIAHHLSLVFGIQFMWPLLGRPIGPLLRFYRSSHVGLACLVLLAPDPWLQALRYRQVDLFWSAPFFLAFVGLPLREAWRGNPEARIIAGGVGLLGIGAGLPSLVGMLGGGRHSLGFQTLNYLGFLAFVGAMAFSLSNRFVRAVQGLEVLNRDLESKVAQRTTALEEAQVRLASLQASASRALLDIPAWAGRMAQELAPSIRAAGIEAWSLREGRLDPLSSQTAAPPDLARLQDLPEGLAEGAEALVPVRGLTGDLRGVLVVRGRPGPWEEGERRLITTFAHHLGGALDLQVLRLELARSEARRAATRQDMLDRGIALLQVCPRCRRCYTHEVLFCDADGAMLEAPHLLPYRLLARYRFIRVLGEGAMGWVLEALDERLEREVAVKLLHPHHFNNPEVRLRFEQEARTLAQIQHPGVIGIFDSGELEDGHLFLVTERLRGSTLGGLLRAWGPGTPAQVAELLRQASAALGAAHGAGLVHRDIKPENIFAMEAKEGLSFKVLDFGLAKPMDLEASFTHTGMVVGTPAYMSPEQLLGRRLDGRSDLYSLAAVGFEALTGRRVVHAQALADICVELVQGEIPRVSAFLGGVPPEVDAAFAQALAKSPEGRPATVEPWAEGLQESLRALPASREGWSLEGLGTESTEGANIPTRALDPTRPGTQGFGGRG